MTGNLNKKIGNAIKWLTYCFMIVTLLQSDLDRHEEEIKAKADADLGYYDL